jgi:hypothetical protein
VCALTALPSTHADAYLDSEEKIAEPTSMSAPLSHVKTVEDAKTASTNTLATANQDSQDPIVKSTLTNASFLAPSSPLNRLQDHPLDQHEGCKNVTPLARTVQSASTESMTTLVSAKKATPERTARPTLMIALQILAKTEVHASTALPNTHVNAQ